MTVKEAILHCEERAKMCDKCGEEHAQLAQWLKELLAYQSIGTAENLKLWCGLFGLDGFQELEEYRKIGTVEDCQKAMKRWNPNEQ